MVTATLVVLNWRAEDATARCVASLRELDGAEDSEIIVVDNESTPASLRALDRIEGVRVLALASNEGFCGGMNAGIAAARGEVVALFNNDLVVDAAWLQTGLRLLEDPGVGIVGGPQIPWDGKSPVEGFGSRALAMVHVDPRHGYAVLGAAPAERRAVAALDGSNLLARSSLLRTLGGFDPDYFAYYEDVDLCARAWALGFSSLYEPTMRVWHRRGASSDRVARRRAFWAARNQLLTIAKHFPERTWRRNLTEVALQHLSDAVLGHAGGVRQRSEARLDMDRRLGRAQATIWAASHARYLGAKRVATIAAGQHDEGYAARLQELATR